MTYIARISSQSCLDAHIHLSTPHHNPWGKEEEPKKAAEGSPCVNACSQLSFNPITREPMSEQQCQLPEGC